MYRTFALRKIRLALTSLVLAVLHAALLASTTDTSAKYAGSKGSLAFELSLTQPLKNGLGRESINMPILDIEGLAKISISQRESSCGLNWKWADGIETDHLLVNTTEIPTDKLFIQFRWHLDKGILDGWVNGTPLRLPGVVNRIIKSHGDNSDYRPVPQDGPFEFKLIYLTRECLDMSTILSNVPKSLLGKHSKLFGHPESLELIDVEAIKGELLYSNPLGEPSNIKDWIHEGPVHQNFSNGWMELSSSQPSASEDLSGHIVTWCPITFPKDYIVQWKMKPTSVHGLCIVFFSARGENGQSIFDSSQNKRDGNFKQYIKGDIKSYHISYYCNTPFNQGRITTNMRKNNKFILVAQGPPGVPIGSQEEHLIQLVKWGSHIQLSIDGKAVVDFKDENPGRYGVPLAGGHIGLRQMRWMKAQYRDFEVFEVAPPLFK